MLQLVKPSSTETRSFYADLAALPEYTQMVDSRYYLDLPDDWVVVMTDVKGSTKAIEAGRYKEVNMIGVSTIVAVQNALPGLQFPFVFGGDGATLAVPAADAGAARGALAMVRDVAARQFQLELRVALIPALDLRLRDAVLKCAKLQISTTQTLALVRGDGWSLAETLLKDKEERYGLPVDEPIVGDVAGLECRWNPLPARQDEIMALIVQSRLTGPRSEEVFRDILAETMSPEVRPVRRETLKLRLPPRYLWAEAVLREATFFRRVAYYAVNLAKVALQIIYVAWRERPAGRATPIQYLREVTENTDYVKFDECLRMVIDISAEQKKSLLAKLDQHVRAGHIDYGHHSDRHALMTCFIQDAGKHIHFIDAAGGGYALAAQRLKDAKRARA
jgi:hypothetical protein